MAARRDALSLNAITIIEPCRHVGVWVFDDPRVGLVQEPFVGGADDMIDRATAHIPNAADGFVMLFSAWEFPGFQFRLDWRRADGSGNVYYSSELEAEGWLCPALLRYFVEPPETIYVQMRAKPG